MSSIDSLENTGSFDSFLMDDLNLDLDSSFCEKYSISEPNERDAFAGIYSDFPQDSNADYLDGLVSPNDLLHNHKLALNNYQNFSPELESISSKNKNSILESKASINCLSNKISDISTPTRKPDLTEIRVDSLIIEKQESKKYEQFNSTKAQSKDLASKSPTFALSFLDPIDFPQKNSTISSELGNKHSTKDSFTNTVLSENKNSLVTSTEANSLNKRQLLPSLQFKTYEEFHRNRFRLLCAKARNKSKSPSSNSLEAHTTLPLTCSSSVNDSPETLITLSIQKESLERRKTYLINQEPESSFLSKVQHNSSSCALANDSAYRKIDLFHQKKNSFGYEALLDLKSDQIANLPLVPEPFISTENSPSEKTSSISDSSPNSENILTESILNLFQIDGPTKALNSSSSSEFKDKTNARELNRTTDFNFSSKSIYNKLKRSESVQVSTPSGLPPKYSRSEKHDLTSPEKSFLFTNNPFNSSQNQVFIDRLDEIIQSQRQCVGLLEEIRDKLPSSNHIGLIAPKYSVSKDVLNKIQDLQDQLYLGLKELNLYHIAENTGPRLKLNKNYLNRG